jgi:predicted RNA methylase
MKNQNNGIQKDSIVITPSYVADYIYQDVKRKPFKNILDIGCYNGSLSRVFRKKHNTKIIGIDVVDEFSDKFDTFMHKDFLQTTKEDFKGLNIDLVVSNPPFGVNREYNELYPQLFLEHVLKIFGKSMPTVFIVGHWFMTNSNSRIEYIKENLTITKVVNLHVATFAPSRVEADIIYFNIKTKKTFDVIAKQKKKIVRRYRSVAFNQEQINFMEDKNITNFSGVVKELLKDKYPEFPD